MSEMNDLLDIKNEVVGLIETLESQGHTRENVQKSVALSFNLTVVTAFREVAHEVGQSAEYGVAFVYSVSESLGGINGALIEKGYSALHLRDSEFMREALISAIEDYTGKDIDEVLVEFEKNLKDMEGDN